MEIRLNQIPGVRGAGLALYNPLVDNWGELIMVAGHPPGTLSGNSGSSWDRVSSDYLRVLGMKMLRGCGSKVSTAVGASRSRAIAAAWPISAA